MVFGILIALQINNWNEGRIEQREIAEYAHSLIKDLELDLEMVDPIFGQMISMRGQIEDLAEYVRDKSIDQIENFRLFYYTRRPYYRPYQWNRTSIEQIKNSGALRKMKNRLLAERISVYDAKTRHLDEDFAHDRRVGYMASEQANRVIDTNYSLKLWETVGLRNVEYSDFPTPSLHQAYKNMDMPLLTNDFKEVKMVVNNFVDLADTMGLAPRINKEIPDLLARAQELIELLNAEYPE